MLTFACRVCVCACVLFACVRASRTQESLELLAKEKHDMKLKLERVLKLVKAVPQQRDAMARD